MTIFSESGSQEGLTPECIIPSYEAPTLSYSAPIVQRKLPSSASGFGNTSFTGSFTTTDDRTTPSIGFITIKRTDNDDSDGTISRYYNGYGVAIRPSTVADQLNVFIVDNATAITSVVLEDVLHTGWGDFAYLAATHVDIEPSQAYNFRMDISVGGALEFWVWSGAFPGGDGNLSYGSYESQSDGNSWGVSSSSTDGYFWYWDDLQLSYFTPHHPIEIYKFKTDDFDSDFVVKAQAYAEGYDGTMSPEYGIIMRGWNYANEEWDDLDSHDHGPTGFSNITLMSGDLDKTTYSQNGFAKIALVGKYPSSMENAIDSMLWVDYTYAESWDTALAHVGGMGDIYIKPNTTPTTQTFNITNVTQKEWLDEVASLPILWISEVRLLDLDGNPTSFALTPLEDWTFVVDSEAKRYSTKEENYILFGASTVGADVQVTYYTYPTLSSMQSFCDTASRRNVTDDYLVKSYAVAELFIELESVGSASPVVIRNLLSAWINEGTKSVLTSTEVAIKLQAEDNINDVTVTNMYYKMHETTGDINTIEGLTLTIESREQFVLLADATHIEVN